MAAGAGTGALKKGGHVLGVSLLACSLVLAACQVFRSDPPASILIVTIDTLRADRLGCYGYFRDTSPRTDELARDAILFERAVTPMATTLPAHTSLMTSTHTLRHGINSNERTFKASPPGVGLQTFAQMLERAGYTSAGFVSSSTVKWRTGIGVGFQHWDQPRRRHHRSAEETTDRVLAWLEDGPQGPFFLWVHYWDPHHPYRPPADYQDRFRASEPELEAYLERHGIRPTRSDHSRLVSQNCRYDEEVLYTDFQLGRVLDRLRALGLYADMAIVVTSDHGEGLGQHGWLQHGLIHNEQLYVPLLIKLPCQVHAGRRRTDLVSLLDVLPTLEGALGLPLAAGDTAQFEGRDLLDGRPRREAIFERVDLERFSDPGLEYALMDGEWKYFHHVEGRDELFNLRLDPHELTNVIREHPQVASRMKQRILELLAEYAARGPGLDVSRELSPEHYEALKSLGYVE